MKKPLQHPQDDRDRAGHRLSTVKFKFEFSEIRTRILVAEINGAAECEIIWEGTISARPDIFLQVLEVLKKYGAVEYVLALVSERTKLAKEALKD